MQLRLKTALLLAPLFLTFWAQVAEPHFAAGSGPMKFTCKMRNRQYLEHFIRLATEDLPCQKHVGKDPTIVRYRTSGLENLCGGLNARFTLNMGFKQQNMYYSDI